MRARVFSGAINVNSLVGRLIARNSRCLVTVHTPGLIVVFHLQLCTLCGIAMTKAVHAAAATSKGNGPFLLISKPHAPVPVSAPRRQRDGGTVGQSQIQHTCWLRLLHSVYGHTDCAVVSRNGSIWKLLKGLCSVCAAVCSACMSAHWTCAMKCGEE